MRHLLLLALLLPTSALLHAAKPAAESWHAADGQIVIGQLRAIYGSLALVAGKDFRAFVPLEKMTDEELGRVADYLADPANHPSTWDKSEARVTKALRRNLEQLAEGKLKPFTPAGPEPRIYLVYFSAGWCGPCHRFTPLLTKAYQEWQRIYPGQVEVILVSWDRSDLDQRKYVVEGAMPWKVLRFSQRNRVPVIEKWAGDGIPCLVAMTPEGDVFFHSYRGQEYLGPKLVMEKTNQLLQQTKDTILTRITHHRLAVIQHVRAKPNTDPVLYAANFDHRRYQTLETDVVKVSLLIDPKGRVQEAEIETPLPVVLKASFARDLNDWLFLPAVAGGIPVERRISLPIQIRVNKTASTESGNSSGN